MNTQDEHIDWWVNDFAYDIFRTKYIGDAGTTKNYFMRLANLVAQTPEEAERFFRLMWNKHFLPGGRILAFGGRPDSKVSLMNCTTHTIADDTLEAIANANYTVMRASSRGQGIGINVKNLRPRGAPVHNAAKTSTGAISFMELINMTGSVIGQEGRRAALLFSIPDDHPDLWRPEAADVVCPKCDGKGCKTCEYSGYLPYDFLHVKMVPGKVEGANISVMISDAFMKAVENNDTWTMRFSGNSRGEFTVERTVPARALFRVLARSAHQAAEPGILYWDTSKRMSNSDLVGYPITGVNACQPANATVLTPEGIRTFADIQVGSTIWGANGWTKVVRKWSTRVKPVYKISTSGGVFLGTEDHTVFSNGERVYAGDAKGIDRLVGATVSMDTIIIDPQDVMDGLMLGDGSKHQGCPPHLYIGTKDEDYLQSEVGHLIPAEKAKVDTNAKAYYVQTTLVKEELPKTFERVVPSRFFNGSVAKKVGFLRGLFSANGCVTRIANKGSRVGLKQSSRTMIEQVQQMLSSLGIASYITVSKAKEQEFSNGVYHMKESYDLNLNSTNAQKFINTIGFIQGYKLASYVAPKNNQFSHGKARTSSVVQVKEYVGDMEVFDITVSDPAHAYWTGGLMVSNCSESTLDQDGDCLLGSMNLFSYVLNPFTDEAYFDTDAFYEDVKLAVKFLDNVNSLEIERGIHTSDMQRNSLINLRRLGLGIMGVADMLAGVGLYYGSDEALSFFSVVLNKYRNAAYEETVILASELGPAKAWDSITKGQRMDIVEQGFFATLPQGIKDAIVQHGTRNINVLSIAPTGTLSNLLGISGGVEPLFARAYTRRTRMHGFDEFVEYVHPIVSLSRAAGIPDEEIWPGAYDVTPEQHITMLAVAQEFVDQSVSKTVNFPRTATEEEVEAGYMLAWKLGCKGLSVYVDASRWEQVLTVKEETKDDVCPECGGVLEKHDGCRQCADCAYSMCSL